MIRLVREIGRGASGAVFEATVEGARVAFKELTHPDDRARSLFQAMKAIAHPNLVQLHDWIDGRGFTMELIEGRDIVTHVRANRDGNGDRDGNGNGDGDGSGDGDGRGIVLGQRVQPAGSSAYVRCDPSGVRRLRAALRGLISGLVCLHDAGIVHGDVRSSNVLVTRDHRVVLLDFGLARAHDDASSYESSAAYAPPELTPSVAADWYATGTLVFECLTGQLPFSGSAQHILVTKSTVPPPRASFLVEGVPDDLDDLALGLLSRVPSTRVVAIDTFVQALLSSPTA